MRRTTFPSRVAATVLALVASTVLAAPRQAAAATTADAERLVVKVDGTASDAARLTGGEVVARVTDGTFVVRVPRARSAAVLALPARERRMAWAEREVRYRAAVDPNDPCYAGCIPGGQWGLRKVAAPAAWNVTTGSPEVLVAVLDTRVDVTHPDLAAKVVPGGTFTSPPTEGCSPDEGVHGTHVAGIVAAATNNRMGVAGMGWNTRVLAVTVLNECGEGTGSTVAQGVYDAVNRGARIINLSLSGDPSRTLEEAVRQAQQAGVVVVAAAGNITSCQTDLTRPQYPAAFPGVVGVVASGRNDEVASFSCRGPWASIAAPGVDILSTVPGGYGVLNGTSMAAPHVAGAAALLFAANPGIPGGEVRARLARGADPIAGTGTAFEWGRLHVARSMSPGDPGYWLVASDGGIFAFGSARFHGSAASAPLAEPVVGMAATPSAHGYWMVTRNGGVLPFGDARSFGDPSGLALRAPVLGMAATPLGAGYWVVAADGGIFNFGDAAFHGSTGAVRLNEPIVGMASTPTGRGYWLVARDGGIFAFGDARFFGSTGAIRLNQPVVGMAPTPTGRGYWLVARDGGMFAFGDARFFGSTGAIRLNQPIVGMRPTRTSNGYWLVASDGGIFAFGDAQFLGSTGALPLRRPIVDMAV